MDDDIQIKVVPPTAGRFACIQCGADYPAFEFPIFERELLCKWCFFDRRIKAFEKFKTDQK